MPCYKPLTAWQTLESTSNGKKKILFSEPREVYASKIQLPCAQCIGCRLDRSLQWAIRCTNEAQLHQQNSFITLTYNQENLPWDGSLVKDHFRKFIKNLRRNTKKKIRYYMCGEYGENLSRPHYHACLFGHDWHDKEVFKQEEGLITYTSQVLERLWGRGFCTSGELNFETAAYTARYITKKITGDKQKDHYETTDPTTGEIIHLEPEYNSMSLRPGIAKDWYNKYKSDIYPSDYLIHVGKKIKTPRYFDRLFEIENGDLEEIKKQRKIRARKNAKNNTPERLAVREKIKHLNYKQLSRSYENNDT